MNITVYCGSSIGNRDIYKNAARELGCWIAKNNHKLVYGGGNLGLMGSVADAVIENKGEVIGIIPSFLVDREQAHSGLTSLTVVSTMAERKLKMLEIGDVYIALPGGPGTLEEISEVISLVRVGQNKNPYVFYNVDKYYTPLETMFNNMVEEGFLTEEDRKKIIFLDSLSEIEEFINSFKN